MNIGKYEVLQELGHGAMGAVYRAHDPRLDRDVAIKLISSAATNDPKLLPMFEKEARAIARLSHPNIVTIFEFDYSEKQPYIVMELLKGSDLTDIGRLENLSLPKKLNLIRQVCEGLAHAHDLGIIHRDIKPANIFLTESNNVKITDFGIARLQSGTMTTGSIMGTPEFMAPERLSTGKTDTRSDLFSTGVVMYWLLTGIRPFAADDFNAIFFRILNHIPPPISLVGIKETQLQELNRIVTKSLAKDPEQRYASAAEMAADVRALEQWIEHGTQPLPAGDTQNIQKSQDFPKTVLKAALVNVRTQPDPTLKAEVPQRGRRFYPALALVVIALLAAGIYGSYRLIRFQKSGAEDLMSATAPSSAPVELRIATGKEKQKWLELFARKFSETPEGAGIQIQIIPVGTLDAFRSMIDGGGKVHAWSPSSDMLEDLFVQEWKAKYNKTPILLEQNLALTPLVFLMWEDRYQAFLTRYQNVSFATIANALLEKQGWATIANKPEWGRFKFGLSDPARFNSGLVLLFVMSHEYHRDPGQLTLAELADKGLQKSMGVYRTYSTGMKLESSDLAADMIAKGPSSYDAIFTYESLALRSLKEAQGRWGKVRLIYPAYNFWMDNPFYVLDVPWSTAQHQSAAKAFLNYIYSPRIQKELLAMSIRPANPEVPLQDPGSPFLLYKEQGTVIDVQNAMDEPNGEIVKAMMEDWSQLAGGSTN